MPGFTAPGFGPSAVDYSAPRFPIAMPSKSLYGSMPGLDERAFGVPTGAAAPTRAPLHGESSRRARIDFGQVLINMVLPVSIFAITYAVLSFKLHYDSWLLSWTIVLCCVLPVVCVWSLSRKAFNEEDSVQGHWMTLQWSLCLCAWLLAVVLGIMNYSTNMKPFYDLGGLNYAASVDPSLSGGSYIDAGRMLFLPGSHLDTSRSMSVRIAKTYCVAPVVNPNVQANATREYDFWAVGVDCCSSTQPQKQWNCGDINNKFASAGMRLMSEQSRPFYRMAVQEAEAAYKIRAKHPIFIEWMQDPAREMASWRDNGMRCYLEGVSSVVVLMFFVSITAGLFFSRASMQGTENLEHDFLDEEGWDEVMAAKTLTL